MVFTLKRSVMGLVVMAAAGSVAAQATGQLRSPWDERPVESSSSSYHCPVVPTLPKDLALYDFYSDAKKSIIDPGRYASYQQAEAQYKSVTDAVEAAADRYRSNGSREAAQCVEHLLDSEATAGALTGEIASNQSYYVQNWTIGALAVCWLKVRMAQPGAPEERAQIVDWMRVVGRSTEDYFQERRGRHTVDSQNNHLYWAGFAVMAVGIAANDRGMFDWGVGTYKDGVSRIQPDGTLPLEMQRGQRALHYHLFAIAPLATMAELGEANGLNLYAEDHDALARLINRAAAGLLDNTYFTAEAGVQQDTPEKGRIKSEDVIAMTGFARRFPSALLEKVLHSTTLRPYGYLGGLPPP